MDHLTWTGAVGTFLNPVLFFALLAFGLTVIAQLLGSFALPEVRGFNPDGSRVVHPISHGTNMGVSITFFVTIAILLAYLVIGVFGGWQLGGIVGGISHQLWPVWLTLMVIFALSIWFKRKLGLYGKLFDSPIAMIGFGLIAFWVIVAVMGGFF